MSKKNKMYSIKEKTTNDLLILKGGYLSVKVENIHQHLEETKRGCGTQESKKTYNRKKNSRINNDYDCSFFIFKNILFSTTRSHKILPTIIIYYRFTV